MKSKMSNCLVYLAIILGSASCNNPEKEVQSVETAVVDDKKIAELVTVGIKEATPEVTDAFVKSYKALSFDELERFNQLLNEQTVKKTIAAYSSNNARVNQSQVNYLTTEIKKLNNYCSESNKLSMKIYGVPYNQLQGAFLDSILTEVSKSYSFDLMSFQMSEQSSNARVTACGQESSPFTASLVNGANNSHTGWASKSDPAHPNDCDYVVQYDVYSSRFSPRNPLSKALCDLFNNRLAYGQRSQKTYLRFGQVRTNAVTQGMANLDVDMQ